MRSTFVNKYKMYHLSFGSSPDRTDIEPIIVMRGEALRMILTVFVTMFLPTTISNIAVKKVFMEFGEVHTILISRAYAMAKDTVG